MYEFKVQEKKRIRVILDTDAACEADDQYAIVHALLTPRFIIKGIIAEQFRAEGSVDESCSEILKLCNMMGKRDIPVVNGYDTCIASVDAEPESEGADLIIDEAMKDDEHPLFVLCQGAITNVAIALNVAPEIAGRFTCIWIGGAAYPEGGWEFNLTNDVNAARKVFSSDIELWQVPMDCYTQMQIGYAELQRKVRPCGELGRYLFDEMQEVGMKEDWPTGESWALGDSPAIGLALNPGCGSYTVMDAPMLDDKGFYTGHYDHKIRVYNRIDSRYILEDFFAKLAIWAENNER